MRIVFDTNVVVAGIVADGLCREIIEIHLPEHDAILSPVLWQELLDKLQSKFQLTPDELPILQLYQRHAQWCEPVALDQPACRDPDDDWVLATAIAGQADIIVTGDDDLLCLDSFQGIAILSPRQFIGKGGK